jgi:hypothetical protein
MSEVRRQTRPAGAGAHLSDLCSLFSGAKPKAREACLGLSVGSAFERLGPLGCTRYRACTCGLSTWWSTTALDETWS